MSAVSINNELYTWGIDAVGRLGHKQQAGEGNKNFTIVSDPKLVQGLYSILSKNMETVKQENEQKNQILKDSISNCNIIK